MLTPRRLWHNGEIHTAVLDMLARKLVDGPYLHSAAASLQTTYMNRHSPLVPTGDDTADNMHNIGMMKPLLMGW